MLILAVQPNVKMNTSNSNILTTAPTPGPALGGARCSARPTWQLGFIAATLVATMSISTSAWAQEFEAIPEVRLDKILPSAILHSGNHRVLEKARIHRNSLTLTIESDFGAYEVTTLPMVINRVHEISTLAQAIDHFTRSNAKLAVKLRGQLQVGGDSIVSILARPLQTSSKLASQLTKKVNQTFEEFNDPRLGNQRGVENAPNANPYTRLVPGDPVMAAHKRSIASALNLDAYSTNPRVQSFLNEVANARSRGNYQAGTISIALGRDTQRRVANGAVRARAKGALARMDVSALQEHNAATLAGLDIGDPLIFAFLGHSDFSPRHKTEISEYLAHLANVTERGALLEAALSARSEEHAAGYVETGRLLGLYHEHQRPLNSLVAAGHIVVARAQGQAMVVVLPFDLLYWDARTQAVFQALAEHAGRAGYTRRDVVLTGIATAAVRTQLKASGFTLLERFGFRS